MKIKIQEKFKLKNNTSSLSKGPIKLKIVILVQVINHFQIRNHL